MCQSTIAHMGLAFLMKLERELPDFDKMKVSIKVKDEFGKYKKVGNEFSFEELSN